MDRMTSQELVLHFADDFGDWIDGDDPVVETRIYRNSVNPGEKSIWVKFESGAQFNITIEEVYE